MRITLHPDYEALAPFIGSLPERFDREGEPVYRARNEIRRMQAAGTDLAVKSFRIPHLVNRIAYTFLRPSKAGRSYRNALKLLQRGIATPAPVACLEERRGGLLARSYYVSAYAGCPGLMRELLQRPLDQVKELAEAFAHFTASMHRQRQTLHLDYSPGNILYERNERGEYLFCLVDINRMRFDRYIGEKAAAFNLRKLWGETETILFIAGVYARDRGFDEQAFKDKVLRYRRKFWRRYVRKHPGGKYLAGE
jgi:serine/threonine protein kinase